MISRIRSVALCCFRRNAVCSLLLGLNSIAFIQTVPAECVAPMDGLVGWWPGDGHARDLQGSNHANLQNGATFTAGQADHGFKLDGVNDTINVPPSSVLDVTAAVTLAAWIDPNTAATSPRVIAAKSSAYRLALEGGGRLQFAITVGGVSQAVTSVNIVPAGIFTAVAGTYDSATGALSVYINGNLENTSNIAATAIDVDATAPLEIGGATGASAYFGGAIDEVQLYKAALSPAQIIAIYNAGRDGVCKRSFRISTVTKNKLASIDASPVSPGSDLWGLAVSPSKVFLPDYNGTWTWNASDLSNGGVVQYSPYGTYAPYHGLVMNLRDQKVYAFARDGTFLGFHTYSTVTFNQLVELDAESGLATGYVIALSEPITIYCSPSPPVGVFAGYDRVLLVESDYPTAKVYNIDLPSGAVSVVGNVTAPEFFNRPANAGNAATWGVAEFFAGALQLAYVGSRDQILRTNLVTNQTMLVASILPNNWWARDFAAAPLLGRWYFHYSYGDPSSLGRISNITLGSADATYSTSPAQPPILSNLPRRVGNTYAISAEATSPSGAVLTFATPTATDRDGKALPVTCMPASGATFPIGPSAVVCSATDAEGNFGTDDFYVIVTDTTPPTLTVPKKVKAKAPKGASGIIVNFSVRASDKIDGPVVPTADPASGSFFPRGKTTVVVLAGDSHNNYIQKNFRVIVK
jgi:hypothetical protein